MIRSDYVCPRFVTVGLRLRWRNWSLNVATITGWTFLPNREVPILWDTRCINNQTPGRSNVSSTRVCLATAAGILLVSPANMQRINAIVRRGKFPSVFYSCNHLREFSHRLYVQYYTESHSVTLCFKRVTPLTVDSLLNLRTLSLISRVSNHHGYLPNSVKIIFIPENIISIPQ